MWSLWTTEQKRAECRKNRTSQANRARRSGPTLTGDEPSPLGPLRAAAPLMRSRVKHKQSLPQTTAQEPQVAAVAVVSAAGGDGELRRSAAPVVLIVGERAVRLALVRGKASSVHVNNNINNNNNN
ncbi:unnamed protein product [Gadus morhua 'NCC']